MSLFLDSFWRAVAYCMLPRVILLSILPLLLMMALAGGLAYFYWDTAVLHMRGALESSGLLGSFWSWLQSLGGSDVLTIVAPLLVIVMVTPLVVIVVLLIMGVLITPAMVQMVAARRFAQLEKKRGASMVSSLLWSLGSIVLALLALVVSMPLWLVPPLVLILPPLIWGWLTYRVMAFDAMAEHASKEERRQLFMQHRWSLLGIGVVCGYLGAAPGIVWASGVVFAAAFPVLIPVAIWIYTLVFVFSSLWFAHFCLAALQQLRATEGSGLAQTSVATDAVLAAPEALAAPVAPPGPPAAP
jgi:hypothetical protein